MEIFPLKPTHLEWITSAHLSTWDATELSVRLGEDFLHRFYGLAVEDDATMAFGAALRGEDSPCCWCLGFTEYTVFNRRLRMTLGKDLYRIIIRAICKRHLPVTQLLAQLLGPKPFRHVRCPEIHLGAFGSAGETFEQVIMLCNLVEHTARALCQAHAACWAVTSAHNRGAQFVLEKSRFKKTDTINQFHRRLSVYEYEPRVRNP